MDDATGVEVTGVDAEGAVAAGGGVVGSGIGVGVTGVGAAAEGAAGAVATVGKSFERFELEEVFVDEAEAEADWTEAEADTALLSLRLDDAEIEIVDELFSVNALTGKTLFCPAK